MTDPITQVLDEIELQTRGESTLAYTGGTWKTDCKPKKGKK